MTRVWRGIKRVWSVAGGELLSLECGHTVNVGYFPSGRCEVSGIGLTRAWCTTCELQRALASIRDDGVNDANQLRERAREALESSRGDS